jgi:hypothetical protein
LRICCGMGGALSGFRCVFLRFGGVNEAEADSLGGVGLAVGAVWGAFRRQGHRGRRSRGCTG